MNLFQNHSGKPLPGTFASITGAPLLVPPSPSGPTESIRPSQFGGLQAMEGMAEVVNQAGVERR